MNFLRLLSLLLLLCLTTLASAQRGGRNDGSSRRPNTRGTERTSKTGDRLSDLRFEDRLWYGAGGILTFYGNGTVSYFALGLTPMVGYRVTPWLSVGPRIGATNFFWKGPISSGGNKRFSTLDYSAAGFARGKIFNFYVQGEYGILSQEYPLINNFGYVVEPGTVDVATVRERTDQLLLGAGYNAGLGQGLSSDIGIFYNVFDDVNTNASPIIIRFTLTWNY